MQCTACERSNQIDTEYTLHGKILKQPDSAKYLGVTTEQNLSWIMHIVNVFKKANLSTTFLRRNLQVPQAHIKANAYKTLVRPQVEYCFCCVGSIYSGKHWQDRNGPEGGCRLCAEQLLP